MPHRTLQASVEELYLAIEDTFRRGGNVVIPTFALERAQELLYYENGGILPYVLRQLLKP